MDQNAAIISAAVAVAGLVCYAVGCVIGYVWGYRGGVKDATPDINVLAETAYGVRNKLAEWDSHAIRDFDANADLDAPTDPTA